MLLWWNGWWKLHNVWNRTTHVPPTHCSTIKRLLRRRFDISHHGHGMPSLQEKHRKYIEKLKSPHFSAAIQLPGAADSAILCCFCIFSCSFDHLSFGYRF